jgi:two-component system, LytTR family, response regulator
MLNAIIIDDEPDAIEVLSILLHQNCKNVTVVERCTSGATGIDAIIKHQPQIVFIDIEMPHVNGFDVLKATAHLNYKVIFTTAYAQFALKAFKFSAIDYLLKPIDIAELQTAVKKATPLQEENDLDIRLEALLKKMQPTSHRIALPLDNNIQLVNASEIVRCESDSNYTHIYLANGKKIVTAKTLKEVEENLAGFSFFRIHQSHLINTEHIHRVIKGEGGSVVMNDGTQLPISRNKKERFLEMFRKI